MTSSSISQWQRILFDPLSWIEPKRIKAPGYFEHGLCRSVINEVILNRFSLVTEDSDKTADGLTRLFIDEWFRLRQVAMLMACLRQRANLASSGLLSTLPLSIKQFTRLPLLDSQFCQGQHLLTTDDLQQFALQELLVFCPKLPLAIRQRVPFLFPEFSTDSDNLPSTLIADSGLLILAVQHEKRNPM